GHTGFTGTAVWLDPPTRSYMIVLTNRVHPSGGGSTRIRELRTRVAAAVGAALFGGGAPRAIASAPTGTSSAAADDPSAEMPSGAGGVSGRPAARADASRSARVLTGLDVLAQQDFAMFAGHAVGL